MCIQIYTFAGICIYVFQYAKRKIHAIIDNPEDRFPGVAFLRSARYRGRVNFLFAPVPNNLLESENAC